MKCRVFGKRIPLLAGFKITNRCNLECIHCPFWKRTSPELLTFDQIKQILQTLYRRGVRILILEGGEPSLWRDGNYTITDVVTYAKTLFFSVGMTTNGTVPLTVPTNTVWVSIDGLRETHNRIRDNSFDRVIKHIQSSNHPNVYANITINGINYSEIPELVKFLFGKVKGITIQFHYPYEDNDTLTLP
ncbi:MAG: radical SAM protein, partial [Thermodesulfobacteriota bacterium]|nr:radical SAM protein [Thermodesulfobacteriota bacterium]